MSRGSKIYKRFGLKFAIAFRIRKTKRKILRKPFARQIQMFWLILKLENPNRFKIYQLLKKNHCVITSLKHLDFIASYFKAIQEWLNSKEYQEQYLKTNHPYPPLLNPQWFIENRESKAESQNTQSQSIESLKDSTPILSYQDIPAELAWEMNLPLPKCDMVKFECHGVGSAMNVFLDKMGIGCAIYYIGFRGRNAYSHLLRSLLEGARAIVIRDFRVHIDDMKLYALVQKPRIMALNQVRDPISNLKSLINNNAKMRKKPLCADNFDNYYLANLCNTQLYKAIVCLKDMPIEFMDMSQIVGDRTIETLNQFAKIFDVPPILLSQSEFYTQKLVNSQNIINECNLLEYLKSHKKLRNKIQRMLDSHLVLIKDKRPDIVQSWKYYQEFERMCEENKK